MPICENCGYSTKGFKGKKVIVSGAFGGTTTSDQRGLCKHCAESHEAGLKNEFYQNLGHSEADLYFSKEEQRSMGLEPSVHGRRYIEMPESKVKRKFGGTGA